MCLFLLCLFGEGFKVTLKKKKNTWYSKTKEIIILRKLGQMQSCDPSALYKKYDPRYFINWCIVGKNWNFPLKNKSAQTFNAHTCSPNLYPPFLFDWVFIFPMGPVFHAVQRSSSSKQGLSYFLCPFSCLTMLGELLLLVQ